MRLSGALVFAAVSVACSSSGAGAEDPSAQANGAQGAPGDPATPAPMPPAAPAGDGGAGDAASPPAMDAGPDTSSCLGGAAATDPWALSTTKGATSYPLTPTPGPFGCLDGATAWPILFTQPVHFTMYENHNADSWNLYSRVQLRAGCDAASTLLDEYGCDGAVHDRLLAPGLYTFVTCNRQWYADFVAEPAAVPANPNTSCATAATLPYEEPHRNYDANSLYFKMTVSAIDNGSPTYLVVSSPSATANVERMAAGYATAEVQTTCGDSSTRVAGGYVTAYSPRDFGIVELNIPNGTYWVVLSGIDPGFQPNVSWDSTFP